MCGAAYASGSGSVCYLDINSLTFHVKGTLQSRKLRLPGEITCPLSHSPALSPPRSSLQPRTLSPGRARTTCLPG